MKKYINYFIILILFNSCCLIDIKKEDFEFYNKKDIITKHNNIRYDGIYLRKVRVAGKILKEVDKYEFLIFYKEGLMYTSAFITDSLNLFNQQYYGSYSFYHIEKDTLYRETWTRCAFGMVLTAYNISENSIYTIWSKGHAHNTFGGMDLTPDKTYISWDKQFKNNKEQHTYRFIKMNIDSLKPLKNINEIKF